MPLAILLSLGLATILYLLVVMVSTATVAPSELAKSDSPLELVYARSGGEVIGLLGLIGMVAAINGVIVQVIMGSRILYGLAKEGWIPERLSEIHKHHHTPVPATILVVAAMVAGTLLFPLVSLAQLTSLLILCIFALVNIALIRIKQHTPRHKGFITVPVGIPILGALLCIGTIVYQIYLWV